MIPILSPAPCFAAIERASVEYDFGHGRTRARLTT